MTWHRCDHGEVYTLDRGRIFCNVCKHYGGIDTDIIRDYLASPAAEKALAEALVPDSTPEWRATEAKRLLAALVADADRRAVE